MDQYTPEEGDDLRLYFWLLLEHLPLHKAGQVWSEADQVMRLPKSTQPITFHRRYAKIIKPLLGPNPTLKKWQNVMTDWLRKMCPEGLAPQNGT